MKEMNDRVSTFNSLLGDVKRKSQMEHVFMREQLKDFSAQLVDFVTKEQYLELETAVGKRVLQDKFDTLEKK